MDGIDKMLIWSRNSNSKSNASKFFFAMAKLNEFQVTFLPKTRERIYDFSIKTSDSQTTRYDSFLVWSSVSEDPFHFFSHYFHIFKKKVATADVGVGAGRLRFWCGGGGGLWGSWPSTDPYTLEHRPTCKRPMQAYNSRNLTPLWGQLPS